MGTALVRCDVRSTRERNQFPSVLLQPLGHLSVSLESKLYGPVAEPENIELCQKLCLILSNVLAITTAIWPSLVTEVRRDTTVRLSGLPV